MRDTLKDIFDNVNSWLKFAEAKNGAIIALNATFIFGILKLNIISTSEKNILDYYLFIAIFMLLVSIIVALLSFIPRLSDTYIKFKEPMDNDNLLYFGDIAKYTDIKYKEKIQIFIQLNGSEGSDKLNEYYIKQIIINSKITFIKFKQFEIAIWFTLSAILTPIGGIILYYTRN